MRTSRTCIAIFTCLLLTPAAGAVVSTAPSAAAPLDAKPAAFTAMASADIVSVGAALPGAGSPADVVVGRSTGTVDPTVAAGNVRATSANLDAHLLLGELMLPLDRVTATAAPSPARPAATCCRCRPTRS